MLVAGQTQSNAVTTVRRRLKSAEDLTARCAPLLAVAILILFAFWASSSSRHIHLQFDELLELSAATAPTNHDVLAFLASGVDYNPPLSHFVIRVATAAFGQAELVSRLPAFLGVLTLLLCLYAALGRQLGPVYGLIGMLSVLCIPIRDYAIQARPYGIVLGLSSLLFVLYRRASQTRYRKLALSGIIVCSAALPATHYYAILVLGIPVGIEVLALWERRRPDWALLTCCLLPPLPVLFLLRDTMKQQKSQLTHYFSRGNLLSFDHGYDILAMDPLIYCVALLLVIGALQLQNGGNSDESNQPPHQSNSVTDIAWGIGFLCLPIAGAFFTQFVTHAYVPRYFLPAAIGFGICLCYAVKRFAVIVPGVALVVVFSLGIGFGKAVLQATHRSYESLPSIEALAAERTPLIFDTPANYLSTYHYFPQFRSSLWVVADPDASLIYRKYDTDDKIMLALASHGGAQTINMHDAVRRWTHFRLVPRSGDYVWVLKCVMNAGAEIRVVQPFGADNFIFDVSVQPEQISRIDACSK